MMSSDEEDRYNDQEATEEMSSDNENATMNNELDNLSRTSDVNLEINDVERDDTESSVASRHQHEAEGKIGAEELPHSGNTESFKTKFESTATEEEQRAERRRERRRRRKLTKEEDGPSEGTTMSTADKFEKGEIDDMHYQKTDVTHDAMATVGTVSATTARFKSGHVSHSSDDDAQNKKNDGDDKAVVETGTAASRRKALEEYAEEARKSKTTNLKVLEEDEAVISPGSAASTRAKLERMSSEEKVLEKEIDTPSRPKRGTAAERRAKFEEKARQSSSDGGSRQATWVKRQSKWPEPKTNYRQRRAQLKTSASTDDETATDTVEMENAKNIEKSKEQELCNFEEPAKQVSGRQSSSEEEPKSPVKTADIRRKLVKMLSDEEKEPSQPVDRIGNARPSSGMARNLRARFEAGDTKQEESHFTGKQPSISSRSGYASRVRERFETGEVAKRRTSSTASEEDGVDHDTAARRSRTSSTRSVEGEAIMMSCTAKELRSRFENSSQNTTQVKRNFVLRPKGNASAISSRFNKTAPASNKCTNCTKTVYPVEMITADDKPFHKFCFKCTECKATLRLGNYAALQGQIYCKPHFKQLFKKKGNYDEGFGRQQHKKQWEEKAKTEDGDSKKFQESDLNAKNTREVGDDLSRDLLNGEDERNDVTVEHTNGYITLNHEQRFSADEIEA